MQVQARSAASVTMAARSAAARGLQRKHRDGRLLFGALRQIGIALGAAGRIAEERGSRKSAQIFWESSDMSSVGEDLNLACCVDPHEQAHAML